MIVDDYLCYNQRDKVQSILFVGWILVRTRWVGFLELHVSHHLFFFYDVRKQDFRDQQQVLVHIIPILGVTEARQIRAMTASYHENLHAELLQAFDKAHLRLWSAEDLQCIPYRFFPASRFLSMFYVFLRFQAFFAELWGHVSCCCGKMLESSVHPCFSHLQEDFWVNFHLLPGISVCDPWFQEVPRW